MDFRSTARMNYSKEVQLNLNLQNFIENNNIEQHNDFHGDFLMQYFNTFRLI